MGTMDQVGLDHQILVNKVGPIRVVGVNSADLGGGNINVVGPDLRKKVDDGFLIQKVEFPVSPRQDTAIAVSLQLADESRAHHAAMAGDVDPGILVHRAAYS